LHLAAQVGPALMYLYIQDIHSLIGDTPQVLNCLSMRPHFDDSSALLQFLVPC
jgi:hypothetical protein